MAQYTKEQIVAEIQRRQASKQFSLEQIKAEIARRAQPGQTKDTSPGGQGFAQSLEAPQTVNTLGPNSPDMSKAEVAYRGGLQGATAGTSDELKGVGRALGIGPVDAAMAATGPAGFVSGVVVPAARALLTKGPSGIAADYEAGRNEDRAQNQRAQLEGPKTYLASEIGGGLTSMAVPGAGAIKAVAGATKAAKAIGLAKAAAGSGLIGAASGAGHSTADLTKGDFAGVAKDAAVGGAVGAALGAAAKPVAAGLGGAAQKLVEAGRTRLFKATVGINKRAFTQMNGKGLLEKAGEYLDDIGIGVGDSTESIARKLTERQETVGRAIGETVEALDDAAGWRVSVDPNAVAREIQDKVSAPLSRLAAARGEHAQVEAEIKAIRELGRPLSFAEAAQQRATMQAQIDYDKIAGRSIAAQAKRDIAEIWNKEIDKQAEPLLKKAGKAGDAYRELRNEYHLVTEILKHSNSRVAGDRGVRMISPSDYGLGGIAGVMTSNPVVGVAAAVANHLARVYGNAASGRAAINMAKMASAGGKAAEIILPPTLRVVSTMPPSAMNEFDQNGAARK